jgi:hypothetical protein
VAQAKKRPQSALERARQQAAAQAEAFARREKDLTGLAVDYLMATSTLERTLEQIQRRIEPLRKEQRDAEEAAQRTRVETVARMRALEASETEAAARLGISLGQVRRSMALARSWEAGGDGPAGEQPTGGPLDRGQGTQAPEADQPDQPPGQEPGGELDGVLMEAPPGLDGWAPRPSEPKARR